MKKKILVTGHMGLIGQTLCEHLNKSAPYEVIGHDLSLPKEHMDHGNILDTASIKSKIEDIVGVIHLAAVSRVIWGEQDPELCWSTNFEATREIAKLLHNSPKKPWLIYASSREVYGQQTAFPVNESAVRSPLNIYAKSKAAAEDAVTEYQRQGLKTGILRFSSVYGRTDDHSTRVVPAFVRACLTNQELRVDGRETTLDFTHVTDVAHAIARAVTYIESNEQLPTIHITSGKPTKIIQLAKDLIQLTQSQSTIRLVAGRNYDVEKFIGDPQKAKDILDWQPNVSLTDGLTKLIQDMKLTKLSPAL